VDTFESLVDRYRQKGVLVDTNLLVLLFVGLCNVEQVSRHKRTRSFTEEDFLVLVELLKCFAKIIVTPHILAETCNLLGQTTDDLRRESLLRVQKHIVERVTHEEYLPSIEIVAHSSFTESGLTDTGILAIAKGRYLVLTTDYPLCGLLAREGSDVINFNHLRQVGWFA
jgi:predicted nucleic acid-binding protein